jgi:hypothetical protein
VRDGDTSSADDRVVTRVDGFVEPSKDELLAMLDREWADWEALIARAAGRLTEPGAGGAWTFQDVIAHVTYYQRFGAELIGADVRHVEVPAEIGFDVERRNRWFYELDRDRPLDDVLAEARKVHRAIVERVRAMAADELRLHPVAWQPWPAWRWLVHLTHEHYPEHVPGLQAWLAEDRN